MSKPEGPVNIDLLAERRERHTLADYAASASETTRAIGEALSRNMSGGHNNLLNVTPIVNPADPRLRFSADDAVDAANGAYSYYSRLTREVSQLDRQTADQARRINRVVNNALINGSNPAPPAQREYSYSPVFLPPAQYEADGNQLSVLVEQRHLPNLPRILTGLGVPNAAQDLTVRTAERVGTLAGWPIKVVRHLNTEDIWIESPNSTGRYPVGEVVQNTVTARAAMLRQRLEELNYPLMPTNGLIPPGEDTFMGRPIASYNEEEWTGLMRDLERMVHANQQWEYNGQFLAGMGINPEGWRDYDQRRAALNRALRGGQ